MAKKTISWRGKAERVRVITNVSGRTRGVDMGKAPDEDLWEWEDVADPVAPEELSELQNVGGREVVDLYWAVRKAVRRYRVARGKGGEPFGVGVSEDWIYWTDWSRHASVEGGAR